MFFVAAMGVVVAQAAMYARVPPGHFFAAQITKKLSICKAEWQGVKDGVDRSGKEYTLPAASPEAPLASTPSPPGPRWRSQRQRL